MGASVRWYKFDFESYYVDIYGLADAEDLAYRRLRDWYYKIEGPIPAVKEEIEKEIGLDWDCIEPVLLRFFVQNPKNFWTQEVWQRDINRRKRRSELNAKAGTMRWLHRRPEAM